MPTHDYAGRCETIVENLENREYDISDHNADLILDYHRDRKLNGSASATEQKVLSYLKILGEHVDQPFDDMDKEDIKDLVEWIQSRGNEAATESTYKEIVKLFWTWLYAPDSEDHAEEVAWIERGDYGNRKLPKDLLTMEDIDAQIEAAYNDRDKALIAMLWETGARIGELIDLTVGDIEDRSKGRKVVIDGKTGPRRLPLKECVPHLNRWLNRHPGPDKDAPLWCKIQQGGPDDQLGYRYIRDKILAKTMDKAGIEKPSNPHHYRHSRASYLANHMTEAQLCQWFGWVQGSDEPAKYVHLSGRDIDDAYDAMHGEATEDAGPAESLLAECPRCEAPNEHDVRYCGGCGFDMSLDPGDAEGEVWTREEVEEIVADAVQVAMTGQRADPDPEPRRKALDRVRSGTNYDVEGEGAGETTAAGPFLEGEDE